MNLYSTDVYLQTLADVYFPGRARSIGHYRTAGRVFRLLEVEGHGVVTQWPFLDFVQPLEEAPPGPVRSLAYLPRAVLETTPAEGRPQGPAAGDGELQPSPFIRWSRFPGWTDFEALVQGRIGNLLPDSRRKRRKLERDLGAVRFVFDDTRPEVFEACIRWKSAQYLASGYVDLFSRAAHVEMFRALHRRGALAVSSLSAGDTLLAVHLGGLADNRLYWWVPAYEPAHAKYSPGRLLLEALLEESHRRGHAEFDFLIGEEAYKWHYATHNRVIGPLGRPPLALTVRRLAQRRLGHLLGRYPPLLEAARALRRRLRAVRRR